jgi:hypothetical protein
VKRKDSWIPHVPVETKGGKRTVGEITAVKQYILKNGTLEAKLSYFDVKLFELSTTNIEYMN